MKESKRIVLLIVIMAVSSLMIAGITIAVLYYMAFDGQKDQLITSALIAISFTLLIVLLGTGLFISILRPIIRQLEDHSAELEKEFTQRRQAQDEVIRLNEALEKREYEMTITLPTGQKTFFLVEQGAKDAGSLSFWRFTESSESAEYDCGKNTYRLPLQVRSMGLGNEN